MLEPFTYFQFKVDDPVGEVTDMQYMTIDFVTSNKNSIQDKISSQ